MKSIFLAAVACLALTAPALAMTDAECNAMWTKADTNNDGMLSDAEATRYAAWMRVKDKTAPNDNHIDKTGFLENCRSDTFTTAAVDEGAPLKGANSFTEGQAQDRAIAAGYSDVSTMEKDDRGIWRGTANKDGKPVKLAVDYKGNVVSN
jgi:hypothetical protein